MMERLPRACAAALAAPVVIALLGIAWVVAAERAGATAFAGIVPQNSAEAAGVAYASEVLRFLRLGEDPHRVYAVRPEILSSAVLRATTLEAAMWSRQLELVELLDREGHLSNPQERSALGCLAADLNLDDVAAYLRGNGAPPCEPGEALARVTARTTALSERH